MQFFKEGRYVANLVDGKMTRPGEVERIAEHRVCATSLEAADVQEAVMGTIPKPDDDSTSSSIDAVRQAWLAAIRAADIERLAALVTDDIVVVHGTGRCVRGRDELKMDFGNAFDAFWVEQGVSTAGLVVRGSWALEIADVETKLTPRTGGEQSVFHSTTATALKRQSDGSWKVGRVLGVLDSPLPGAK